MALAPTRRRAGVPALAALLLLVAPSSPARAGTPDIPIPPASFPVGGTTATGPADRDLVIGVRLAALWEIPAGNLAQRRSANPRVARIGRSIATQHVALDRLARDVARTHGIALPSRPNDDQLGWLAEMRETPSAEAFDRIFVNRLRAAGGQMFPAIATVRDATRNDAVRQLAQQVNQFVMTQMTLLEGSGIVDFDALPTAPDPVASGTGPVPVDGRRLAAARSDLGTGMTLAVLGVAVLAAAAAALSIVRTRSPRRKAGRTRRLRPPG